MLTFFVRRLIYAVIAMWAVSVVSFVIINLPAGDFVTTYIATQLATGNLVLEDEAESLREFYGLNDPVYVQYSKWITRILRGQLGFSFEFNAPVRTVLGMNLFETFVLGTGAIVFIWTLAGKPSKIGGQNY